MEIETKRGTLTIDGAGVLCSIFFSVCAVVIYGAVYFLLLMLLSYCQGTFTLLETDEEMKAALLSFLQLSSLIHATSWWQPVHTIWMYTCIILYLYTVYRIIRMENSWTGEGMVYVWKSREQICKEIEAAKQAQEERTKYYTSTSVDTYMSADGATRYYKISNL